MIEMFRAIGFHVPDEATYNKLAETAEALGEETRIDRRGATLHGRCWRVGDGLEIWTVLRESRDGLFYVDCRPAFRPRYMHALGPWELVEYEEEGEAVVEGRIGRGTSPVSFELQNLTELETETFLSPRLTVGLAGLAYDLKPADADATLGLRASDREGAAPPPDGNDYVVVGRAEKCLPIVNPLTGARLLWLHLNAGDVRLEVVASGEGGEVPAGAVIEAEVWLQGYVLTEDTVKARYEGRDPEWEMSEAWSLLRRGN
jgi:hypothetical protein